MQSRSLLKSGGICLIILAVVDVGIDIINSIIFEYPLRAGGILHMNFPQVFGQSIFLDEMLTLKSLLPLLLIPGAISIYHLFEDKQKGLGLNALIFAIFAALAWMMSLMLWPSLNWFLAKGLLASGQSPTAGMQFLINGINDFGQVFLGGYMKFTTLGLWLCLVGFAGLRTKLLPAWFCYFGIVLAIITWVILLIRWLVPETYVLAHSISFAPIINLWIFLLGCYLLLPRAERV